MEDFTQELVEVLKGMTDPGIRVISMEVTKVNDQTSKAISLVRPELNVSRLFYPREYYEEYCRGKSIAEIAEKILETFQDDAMRAELELRIGILNPFDFESVKYQLYCRLLNLDRNRKYLENKCYLEWLDFAVCFYIMAESREDRRTIMNVTSDLFHTWEVSKDELLETALENLCNDYPAKIEDVKKVLERYICSLENPEDFAGYMNLPDFPDGMSMHVLTNGMCEDGVIVICYPDVLKKFAEEQGVDEVIIFPSSLHEIILVPKQKGQEMDAEYCSQIIREINTANLLPEEVLGDHAYIYCRKSNQIKIFR